MRLDRCRTSSNTNGPWARVGHPVVLRLIPGARGTAALLKDGPGVWVPVPAGLGTQPRVRSRARAFEHPNRRILNLVATKDLVVATKNPVADQRSEAHAGAGSRPVSWRQPRWRTRPLRMIVLPSEICLRWSASCIMDNSCIGDLLAFGCQVGIREEPNRRQEFFESNCKINIIRQFCAIRRDLPGLQRRPCGAFRAKENTSAADDWFWAANLSRFDCRWTCLLGFHPGKGAGLWA